LAVEQVGPVEPDGHILSGSLHCTGCGRSFPIENGVPRLLPESAQRHEVRDNTAARFGFEWNEFSDFEAAEEEASMATWLRPQSFGDLAGQTVLDAGCGMGRHATIAARHGVNRLVGMDLGHAVDAAFANTRHLENVCIVQGDIYHPPLKDAAFDCAYSLGVLHHVPEPKRGFAALAPKVRAGGWFQVWVYGKEGGRFVVPLINTLRRFTSIMSLRLLKVLSWVLTIPVWFAARTLYRLPGVGQQLPFAEYMRWLAPFTFRKMHVIVFDQLVAPVAYFMTQAETEEMVRMNGWSIRDLEHSRGMSWGICVDRIDARPTSSSNQRRVA
jgi:SAM-dependent methyltransferase